MLPAPSADDTWPQASPEVMPGEGFSGSTLKPILPEDAAFLLESVPPAPDSEIEIGFEIDSEWDLIESP